MGRTAGKEYWGGERDHKSPHSANRTGKQGKITGCEEKNWEWGIDRVKKVKNSISVSEGGGKAKVCTKMREKKRKSHKDLVGAVLA